MEERVETIRVGLVACPFLKKLIGEMKTIEIRNLAYESWVMEKTVQLRALGLSEEAAEELMVKLEAQSFTTGFTIGKLVAYAMEIMKAGKGANPETIIGDFFVLAFEPPKFPSMEDLARLIEIDPLEDSGTNGGKRRRKPWERTRHWQR